jgi:hypothetical protein
MKLSIVGCQGRKPGMQKVVLIFQSGIVYDNRGFRGPALSIDKDEIFDVNIPSVIFAAFHVRERILDLNVMNGVDPDVRPERC